MKQIILSLSFIALCSSTFAQEAADKKFQAGLVAGFGMNFVEMGTNKLKADGIGTDLTIGTNLSFSINETIGFVTGIEIDFETLKFATAGDPLYYKFRDKTILKQEDVLATDRFYKLETRKQKPVYISIPTMMLFRTKFIGYFRYFGKFGLRTSILASNKANDTGYEYIAGEDPFDVTVGTLLNQENMVAKGEMLFIKSVAGFSGGAEWNFSGSTSLVAELGFYFGFTPLYLDRKVEKSTLYEYGDDALGAPTTAVTNYFSNSAKHNQLRFKVSILF